MAAAETISTGVYQVRPVASLKPYEKNARTHSAEAYTGRKAVLEVSDGD